MSDREIAIFNPAQVPAFAKQTSISPLTQSLMGTSGFAGKRLSIKGGVFRLIAMGKEVGQVEERYLDVVIVNAAPKISRTYYAGTYVEGETVAPDCWSADGATPDPTVVTPQHANCMDCPQNVKGSGQNDSRACRFSQRLAVVLANDVGGDVLQLQLPAQSIFGPGVGDSRPLQAYAKYLAAQKVGVDMVVSRIRFDTVSAVPKLFFKAERWLTKEEYATTQAQGQTDDALQAVTMTVFQRDAGNANAKQSGESAIPGTRPDAAPQIVPVVDAPKAQAKQSNGGAEPVKRVTDTKAPPAVDRGALESLVAQWADDSND